MYTFMEESRARKNYMDQVRIDCFLQVSLETLGKRPVLGTDPKLKE